MLRHGGRWSGTSVDGDGTGGGGGEGGGAFETSLGDETTAPMKRTRGVRRHTGDRGKECAGIHRKSAYRTYTLKRKDTPF